MSSPNAGVLLGGMDATVSTAEKHIYTYNAVAVSPSIDSPTATVVRPAPDSHIVSHLPAGSIAKLSATDVAPEKTKTRKVTSTARDDRKFTRDPATCKSACGVIHMFRPGVHIDKFYHTTHIISICCEVD